jgi:phage baseplate assembly protein W
MMAQSFFWPIIAQTPPALQSSTELLNPLDRTIKRGAGAFLGAGLLRPFRRDEKNDFAHAEGIEVVRACVGQILGTTAASDFTQGEMPWRTEFGSVLYLLRQQRNDAALQELGRHYIVDALSKWEPRVRVKACRFTRPKPNVLEIRIRYDIVSVNSPGNAVMVADVDQTITA